MSTSAAQSSRLSAVIVVGRAEANLDASIGSVAGLADETLLVDISGQPASTIVDLTGELPRLLRAGAVSEKLLLEQLPDLELLP